MEELPDSLARNELLANLKQMRADALQAEQRKADAIASQARILVDSVLHLQHRLDSFEKKQADKKRRDEEAKAQREKQAIADYINGLPDPDNPASYGEDPLTVHGPSHPADKEQLRASHMGKDDADIIIKATCLRIYWSAFQ
jgi:hypothetical protein